MSILVAVNVGAGHRQRTTGEWGFVRRRLLATVTVYGIRHAFGEESIGKKIGGNETEQNLKGIMSAPSDPSGQSGDAQNARLVSMFIPDWQNHPARATIWSSSVQERLGW